MPWSDTVASPYSLKKSAMFKKILLEKKAAYRPRGGSAPGTVTEHLWHSFPFCPGCVCRCLPAYSVWLVSGSIPHLLFFLKLCVEYVRVPFCGLPSCPGCTQGYSLFLIQTQDLHKTKCKWFLKSDRETNGFISI